MLLVLVTFLPRAESPIDLRWDAGAYYVLGTSLAEGKGYRLLSEPGEIQALQYPPLVPLIVAAHQRILGTTDPIIVGLWLNRTWIVLFGMLILAIYLLARRFFARSLAFGTAAVCSLNYSLFFHSSQLTAELPFMLASLVLIISGRSGVNLKREIFAGLAGTAAFLARTMGVALFAAWIADAFVRRQYRRAAARALVALVCVSMWSGYVRAVERSNEYASPAYAYQRAAYQFHNVSYATNLAYKDPFRPHLGLAGMDDILQRIASNIAALPTIVGGMLTSRKEFWDMQSAAVNRTLHYPVLPQPVISGFLWCVGAMALGSVVLLFVRGERLIAFYVVMSLAIISYAPWEPVRYIAPLIPFLLLGLVASAIELTAKFALRPYALARRVKWLPAMVLLGAFAQSAVAAVQTYRGFSVKGEREHPNLGRVA
jgi:hypothetical protein